MKLGELFIELGITGDIKPLKQALSGMDSASIKSKLLTKYLKDLKNATTDEERALIKQNFAQKICNLRTTEGIRATLGLIGKVVKVAAVVTTAVVAFDRMANAVANANQRMISFQRQTGISLSTLNKYASASAAVNYGATPEGMAQSLQNVANNLWDIRMGRGDISPYQELAFVGGKAINVWGKSVEQVIEELRESLKGVNDLQATNIITRMGFSADDLLMLRMTKKEFAEIQNMFLSPKEQENLNELSLELKKIHLELDLIYKRVILKLMPYLIKIGDFLVNSIQTLYDFTERLSKSKLELIALTGGIIGIAVALKSILIPALLSVSKAIWSILTTNPALMALIASLTTLFLLLDDYVTWSQGGQSLFDWGQKYVPENDPSNPYYGISEDQQANPSWKNKIKAFGLNILRGAATGGSPIESSGTFFSNPALFSPIPNKSINNSANVTQNNALTIHTSQTNEAVLNGMMPLTKQLNTIIGVNSTIGK